MNDSLRGLHERLGCHAQHSIPIGFYYAKWSEKLHFHIDRIRAHKPTHSSSLSSRSRTPSPATVREPRSEARLMHKMTSKIASSPAAGVDMSIETAEDNLNDIKLRRAAIFDETKDGRLRRDSTQDKTVFCYREGRRLQWQAVASEVMMNESEWKDQYDREELEKLRFLEEQLEALLEEHLKSIGDGPAGQESN